MTAQRTDSYLANYSGEHLFYEVQMLLECELRMRDPLARPVDLFWLNSLVETARFTRET